MCKDRSEYRSGRALLGLRVCFDLAAPESFGATVPVADLSLAGHAQALAPTAFVEWALAAASECEASSDSRLNWVLEEFQLGPPLRLPATGHLDTQTLIERREGGWCVRCFARDPEPGHVWREHARVHVSGPQNGS